MESIGSTVLERLKKVQAEMVAKVKKRGGINSRRAELVLEIMNLMHEHTRDALLKNANKRELAEYEQVKDNPDDLRAWSRKVYNRRFKYWLGRTRRLHPENIDILVKQAKGGKNPAALFNHLLSKFSTY